MSEYMKNYPRVISLPERCGLLRKYIRKGYKISVTLYGVEDYGTFRYRAYNIYEICLDVDRKWKSVYFFLDEIQSLRPFLKEIDIITIVRVQWTFELNEFIWESKRNNVRILFDMDDLVAVVEYTPLMMNTVLVKHDEESIKYWFSYIARIRATALLCDGITATNEYLGNLLSENFNVPVRVIPNFLNKGQVKVSEEICVKNAKDREKFVIGYFSGTSSHVNDFRVCGHDIIDFLQEYSDARLLVVGFMDFPDYMKQLIQEGRIEFKPLVDVLTLQELIASVDLNIVPLVQNKFTHCKSELKFFEAAIVKTLTIASPTYCYKKAIQDSSNGFLCNDGKWYSLIERAYKEDCSQMVERANEFALNQYFGEKILNCIEDAYDFFTA